ncbi:hypothetical protein B0H16DRAFT_1856389 [Mycena metata]|uniref:Uncharacterized protein n=1 Tax=Mycena metata TaxID=1033252 RepID=A0AAD7N4P7_9AGAR|nr:hypothetical protein B0H16DRAFT_1856389 [Mycena metata]
MDALLTRAQVEQTAGILTEATLMKYMAAILRARSLRRSTRTALASRTGKSTSLQPPRCPPLARREFLTTVFFSARIPPAANDAILALQDDVLVSLETTLHAREALGWARPGMCIIVKIDGVREVRCFLDLPVQAVNGMETIRVFTLKGFHDAF